MAANINLIRWIGVTRFCYFVAFDRGYIQRMGRFFKGVFLFLIVYIFVTSLVVLLEACTTNLRREVE